MLIATRDYRELAVRRHAVLPEALRVREPPEWVRLNRRGSALHTFLEGPELDRDGSLLCVDIPNGRVLRVDGAGQWSLVCRYDGWPNGLKRLPGGRWLIADARHGLVELDAETGTAKPLLTHALTQRFLGVNDLHVTEDGTVWFTDQGQTGLHDPAGRVYRWREGELRCMLDRLPSPNGLRVGDGGHALYVAVTRDNSVWRAPLTDAGEVTKVGRFASFYGPTGPDGIHIDRQQRLWVCLPGADTVWVLNRKGEVTARASFPDGAFPTNLAFDEERQRAFVTCTGLEAIFTVDAAGPQA